MKNLNVLLRSSIIPLSGLVVANEERDTEGADRNGSVFQGEGQESDRSDAWSIAESEILSDELEVLVTNRLEEMIDARDVAAWRSLRNETGGARFSCVRKGC